MTTIHDHASLNQGGTRHLLLRIARRGIIVLSAGCWIGWIIGGFGILVVDPPLPRNLSLTLRIDEQGMMLQKGPAWRRQQGYVVFQRPNPVPWEHSLSDQESTWITRGIVVSAWTASGMRYQLLGVRHIVLLSGSVVAFLALYWRRPGGNKPTDQVAKSNENG